jgi:hypothetical protein
MSNCLIWALCMWARWGGYIIARKSRWGPFPHFIWSPDLKTFLAYAPIKPRARLLPPPLFRGKVVREEPRPH